MTDKVLVAAGLIRPLRLGLRREIGYAALLIARLMLEIEDEPSSDEYEQALEVFNAAQSMWSDLRPRSDQPPADIELDLGANAPLVLKALEGQHRDEIERLQEAGLYGPNRDAAREEVKALGDLVKAVKLRVPKTRRDAAGIDMHARRGRPSVRPPRGCRPRR
ncbi:MAG TPA: hypothetical protein VGY76_10250 [Solirubrobacteraceae bacterium]|jgi:hypothetical protein|nr:hypothetical protein [Solirubrobacteraceae bacterium]